jgi:hypothetical protein
MYPVRWKITLDQSHIGCSEHILIGGLDLTQIRRRDKTYNIALDLTHIRDLPHTLLSLEH